MNQENKSVLNLPPITDEDICWAATHLGLKENDFHGKHGNDPRSDVLRNMQSIDIAACPGSGKTTLLVAKLAILAENWSHRTQGICVLSHTNKAREVIEAKLGNTKAGRNLLSYPHYVGTIHGFVNEFLALPWLRSLGYPINTIETEICQKRRWKNLSYKARSALENRFTQTILNIKSPDFSVGDIPWGKKGSSGKLGKDKDTYKDMVAVCKQSAEDGYFCYDEMFVWANDLVDKNPLSLNVIRDRFPMLFIDEAQDNSEEQSAILHRIFMAGDTSVIRQRFGDPNQAIYDSMSSNAAETDIFPDESPIDIPNSHRFNQSIADLANPLGLLPIPGGLVGHGPAKSLASGEKQATHTILLFNNDSDSAKKILDAYAELLVDTFSEQELSANSFVATAIGQVHRPPDEEQENKFPHHIGHYWPEYDCELSKSDLKPHTFMQYIVAGQALAERKKEAFPAVEKIAVAILRLASMGNKKLNYQRRRYKHRLVNELLASNPIAQRYYECLVCTFAIERSQLTKSDWDTCWREATKEIAESISECELIGEDVDEFMRWDVNADSHDSISDTPVRRDNIYCYPSTEQTKVKIRIGSIHSVKGDEHTATLVLETFWHAHNMEDIIGWITGNKTGSQCSGTRKPNRLKLHYVAMTRPTHLLCLALKRSTFENDQGEINGELTKKVEEMGWNIKYIN